MKMRDRLSAAVDPGNPNRKEDIQLAQTLLNRQSARTGTRIPVTKTFDRATLQAIQTHQQRILHEGENCMANLSNTTTPRWTSRTTANCSSATSTNGLPHRGASV